MKEQSKQNKSLTKSQNSKYRAKSKRANRTAEADKEIEQQNVSTPTGKKGKKNKNLKKVRKDSIWQYILDSFFNKSTKGAFDKQTSDFQVSFNRIFSETHKKEVFHILSYPTYIYPGHLEDIREKLRESVPISMRDDFDLQIVQLYRNNEINVFDKKITRLHVAAQRSYKQLTDDINRANELIVSGQSARITQEKAKEMGKKSKELYGSYKSCHRGENL